MENRFLISVVIPLYNKERSIVKTLNSVLRQSYLPKEIIVVDDGSTDSSVQCVLSLQSKLVKIIRKTNGGVSSARNYGFKIAISDYIAYLDADDLWLPNHLETIASSIQQYPTAAMFTTMHLVRRGDVDYRNKWINGENQKNLLSCFISSYAKSLSLISSSNVCISKEALKATGGFPEGVSRGEDVITAIYNQDADNRSEYKPLTQLPHALVYISTTIKNSKLSDSNLIAPLRCLYSSIGVSTSAGLVLSSQYYSAYKILLYTLRSGMYLTALRLGCILLVPRIILSWLKSRRRQQY